VAVDNHGVLRHGMRTVTAVGFFERESAMDFSGTPNPDTFDGTPENDIAFGGEGIDILVGSGGTDLIAGGAGDDDIAGDQAPVVAQDPAVIGDDILFGDDGSDLILAGPGQDLLFGGPGDDILAGGAGSDNIIGDAGADEMFGDEDVDFLTGGAGADLFGFDNIAVSTVGTDTITDFSRAEGDKIVLDYNLNGDHIDDFAELQAHIAAERIIIGSQPTSLLTLSFLNGDAIGIVGIDTLDANDWIFPAASDGSILDIPSG